MKKILFSLTLALSLPFGLSAEDTTAVTPKVDVNTVISELCSDYQKFVIVSEELHTIEGIIQGLQQKEQALLTQFMTRGIAKNKFETLGNKIGTMLLEKKDHEAIVNELMSNSAHKAIKREIEQLVCLVEEEYAVMVKAAAYQNVVKELLSQMQSKVDVLIAQGYTQEQVTELIQTIVAEVGAQSAAVATPESNVDNA